MHYWLCLALLVSLSVRANEPVQLRTSESPPYQLLVNGELSGVSVGILQCVLKRMDWPYNIHLLPWARAIEDLKQQATDGIFTTAPEAALDRMATMSDPFALEKWHWFYRHQPDGNAFSPQGKTLGVIRSSNAASWLRQQGLPAAIEVNAMPQLIHLLQNGRIDAFLGDEQVVRDQLVIMKLPADIFSAEFSHYMPLGIYFSHDFLSRHPAFLSSFNRHLGHCAPTALQLSEAERRQITTLVRERVQPLFASAQLLPALKADNQRLGSLTATHKEQLDRQWFAEAEAGKGPLYDRITQHPLAAVLQRIQQQSAGLISEIFITGQQGVNLTFSQPTTDMDQSDEKPYQDVMAGGKAVSIGPIDYDESSHRFQIKVAWRVGRSPEEQGMIVVGLDVEHALRASR